MLSTSLRPLSTQHTANTRNEHSCPQRDSNPRFQQSNGRRPTLYTTGIVFIYTVSRKLLVNQRAINLIRENKITDWFHCTFEVKQSILLYYALSTDMYRRFGVACFLHLQGLSSLNDLFSAFKCVPLIQQSAVDSVQHSVSLTLPCRTPVPRRLYSNKGSAALLYIFLYNFAENR